MLWCRRCDDAEHDRVQQGVEGATGGARGAADECVECSSGPAYRGMGRYRADQLASEVVVAGLTAITTLTAGAAAHASAGGQNAPPKSTDQLRVPPDAPVLSSWGWWVAPAERQPTVSIAQ